MKQVVIIIINIILSVSVIYSVEYHVAKHGKNSNSGLKDSPFLTIQQAANIAVAGALPIQSAGNLFVNGAKPSEQYVDYLIMNLPAPLVRINNEPKKTSIKIALNSRITQQILPVIDANTLGKTITTNLKFEGPDGENYAIDSDFSGHKRTPENNVAGPFTKNMLNGVEDINHTYLNGIFQLKIDLSKMQENQY